MAMMKLSCRPRCQHSAWHGERAGRSRQTETDHDEENLPSARPGPGTAVSVRSTVRCVSTGHRIARA
eukprot:3941930-Rhodomonas_salina.24